jgi:hypothetical protein
MSVLTYSEGPGRSLGHASALVTVERDPDNIVTSFIARLNSDRTPREHGWWSPIVSKDD